MLALALLTRCPSGGRLAARRAATLLTSVAALLIGGTADRRQQPTSPGSSRPPWPGRAGTDSPLAVLADSWSWAGLIVALAICGVIISWASREDPPGPGCSRSWPSPRSLGPLEQARLHTAASLNKHVGLGAWFAAIAAGYAVDRFIAAAPAGRTRAIICWACVIALAFPLTLGVTQSRAFATSWPNAASFTAIFGPLADHGTGHLLVEDPSIAEYYLPAGSQWQRWSSTRNIILPSGASTGRPATTAGVIGAGNPGAFARYIAAGYFTLVALNFADTTALDHQHHHRPAPQPPLPPHPGRPLRHRPASTGHGHLHHLAIPSRERPPSQAPPEPPASPATSTAGRRGSLPGTPRALPMTTRSTPTSSGTCPT